jgi:outer membrane immunogenic protein
MKKLSAAGAAFTGFIAVTSVMGAAAPAAAQMVAPPFDWARCYGGAHVAYGWGNNGNDFNKAIASGPTEGEGFPAEFASLDHTTKGWGLGVQAGCNWQISPNWLIGVEGEFLWSGIKGQHTNPEDGADPGTFSRFKSENRWDADVALRIGYAWPKDLLYGKAGWDLGNFRYTEWHDDFPTTHACPGGGTCSVNFSKNRSGLLLGIGWEHAWSANWTTKIEYDYAHFGSTNIPYPDGAASIHSFKVRDRKNIIQVGLNYYFP